MLAEVVHPFKGAVGPFDLNGPSIMVGENHIKDRFLPNFDHPHSIATNLDCDQSCRRQDLDSALFKLTHY